MIILPIALAAYDDWRLGNLKETDPVAFQQMINDLEGEIARVPAPNAEETIRLYRELLKLDPENLQYADRLADHEEGLAAALAAEEVAKAAAEAAENAEEVRKGFHCLSRFDGAHTQVKNFAEEQMRDPDSFEHIETRITPVSDDGNHTLIMTYRARNGFGGITEGRVVAEINNDDCSATNVSIE